MPCYVALGYPAKNAARPAQKVIHARDRMHGNTWNGSLQAL